MFVVVSGSFGVLAAGAAWMILAAVPVASLAAAQTTMTQTEESTIVTTVPAATMSSARDDSLASLALSMIFSNRAKRRRPLRAIELRTVSAEKLGRFRLGRLPVASTLGSTKRAEDQN